jgi:hypothetical protein
MKWLIDDLSNALAQLKRRETWIALALLAGFGLLAFAFGKFAFRTDSVLRFIGHSSASCRDLSNVAIIFLFCAMIFFLLAVVATLGEFQQYFEFRKHASHHQARQALIPGCIWGGVAVSIAVAALLFFNAYCR